MTSEDESEVEGIVVTGYTRRYAAAVDKLLGIEGGYVNDPLDRGGATKYGISLRFLAAEGAFDEDGDGKADFDLDFDGDIDGTDIRLLTLGDARFLYLKFFWRRLGCDELPLPIGEMVFDQAVNGGAMAAKKMLQRAVNHCLVAAGWRYLLRIDGGIGPVTLERMNWVVNHPAVGMGALIEAYREQVKDRYQLIVERYPSQKRFLKGWLNRADELGR